MKYSLTNKVFACVADSAKNIAKALYNFDGLIRAPCSGHRINSYVNDLFQARVVTKKFINQNEFYFVKEFNKNVDLRKTEINKHKYNKIITSNEAKDLINGIIKVLGT